MVRIDVRVPDAGARHAVALGEPARPDVSRGRRSPAAVRPRARSALGHLRVGAQRPRSRPDLPVLQLRRPRPGPGTRAQRGPRRRAVRDRAGRHGRRTGGGEESRRADGGGRPRPLWVLRGARLHTVPASRECPRCGRPGLHGPSPGDDPPGAGERPPRRSGPPLVPRGADRPGGRASAPGAATRGRGRGTPPGRGGPGARARPGLRRAGLPAVHLGRRPVAAHAPLVQRSLFGDADRRGLGLQPLQWPGDHPLARGSHPGPLGDLRLLARCRVRTGMVGYPSTGRGRRRHVHRQLLRGPRRVSPARRHGHHDPRGDRLAGGQRRAPSRVAHQLRRGAAGDRDHVVRRAGARATRRGGGAPGLLEPVRADRVRPAPGRPVGDPPLAARPRSRPSGPPTWSAWRDRAVAGRSTRRIACDFSGAAEASGRRCR